MTAGWALVASVFYLSGCGPKFSFPANTVPEAIEDICLRENKMEVKARVVGKTVGALVYLDSLTDAKGQIPKEVHEAMGKVLQAVTRVALSTDLTIDFCTVVLRDRKQGNELVVTRSLDDIRRAQADMIGIEESINRTLFGQSRQEPSATDAGAFVLKEVTKEDFLAEQMVQRIRFHFSKDTKGELSLQNFVLVDGNFEVKDGRREFHFAVIALKADDPRQLVLDVFKVVNSVLKGYQFTSYDLVEIQDYMNRQKLVVGRQAILDYQNKKLTEDDLLKNFLVESQSIQEAFKLFGFTLPRESNGKEAAAVASATP
ncbi:MAG: hypothetical protein ACREH5_07025 [Candidatus Omnitrophota bacterium]